ncbi:Csu type fimbrial protein [Nitrosomonas sp. ANs5]|uniref:Csu type fimbrial protein n=1 Tax=Nitrosomonas sp. ANs5 TaxID=3423941 RepID=UPI003D32FF40
MYFAIKNLTGRRLLVIVVVAWVLSLSQTAYSETATTTFSVSATVDTSCLVEATPLAFGNYDPTAASDLDGANTVTVTCTTGTPYTIGLNAGIGDGATVSVRKMTSGSNTLEYTLYQDASRTTLWGNTIGTDTLGATAVAAPTVHNVYGRVFSGQPAPAGAYADTITVTLDF